MASVLIPWRGGCADREAALDWVLAKYAKEYPACNVSISTALNGPWSKGSAIVAGLSLCKSDPVVVADADVWCDGVASAVRAIECGVAGWAVPHHLVRRLTRDATAAVLQGGQVSTQFSERPYVGRRGGGIVVMAYGTLLDVPMDPRFLGWGQEDESWDYALTTLIGEPWRGDAELIHLWHPSPERWDRRRGSIESWQLMKQYRAASGDPELMREVVPSCLVN